MNFINSILGTPLGFVMWFSYLLTNNYILSLILFTLVIRLALIPLTIKQQKSSVKMAVLKPQMEEIQKKYANNREKLNQEMMDMYKREGYNPASGCLPVMIQLPILIGLFDVVYRPLTYILRIPSEVINYGINWLGIWAEGVKDPRMLELVLFRRIQAGDSRVLGAFESFVNENPQYAGIVEQIQAFNMNFWGMNLTEIPAPAFNALLIVPILAGLTSLCFSVISMRLNPMQMEGTAGASMKTMMYIMPLVSVFFTFSFPAGVGLYWSVSNVIGIGQSLLMNKLHNPREMAEKARREAEERREKERLERIEMKKKQKAGLTEKSDERALSQKELNRRRLAEARRKEAEKYGEEYTDEE